jgi:hypothetical protein
MNESNIPQLISTAGQAVNGADIYQKFAILTQQVL